MTSGFEDELPITFLNTSRGSVAIVTLEEKIGGHRASWLREKLMELEADGCKRLVLNLGRSELLDSFGAEVIGEVLERGVEMAFVGVHGAIEEDLIRNGLLPSRAQSYATVEEALSVFAGTERMEGSSEAERRVNPRKECSLPVQFTIAETNTSTTCQAVAMNIGTGGVFLAYIDCSDKAVDMKPSRRVSVSIKPTDENDATTKEGHIAHITKGKYQIGLGIQFDEPGHLPFEL